MEIVIKKEFRDLIFPLSPEEFSLLENSILQYGVKDPLVVWKSTKNYLLDGHHRYKIITQHNIKKYPVKTINFDSRQEAINWIIQNQLARRNCTPEGVSYLRGLRYRNEKKTHGGNRRSSSQNAHMKTDQRIAQLYSVSAATIRRDERYADAVDQIIGHFRGVKRKILKNQILTRQINLTKKETIELSKMPEKCIIEVLIDGREFWRVRGNYNWNNKQRGITRAKLKLTKHDYKFYTGDAEKIAHKYIKDESIDCIITDPPYRKKDLPNIDKLGRIAQRVLQPSGFCIFYMGKMYLDQVMSQMSQYLDYYWQVVILHHGSIGTGFNPIASHSHRVNTFYKPLLIYQKPPKKRQVDYFDDLIRGSGIQKGLHPWQQSVDELKPIIETFTSVNSVVLDPFCGSGTTGAACCELARKCISIDIDSACIQKAKKRIMTLS